MLKHKITISILLLLFTISLCACDNDFIISSPDYHLENGEDIFYYNQYLDSPIAYNESYLFYNDPDLKRKDLKTNEITNMNIQGVEKMQLYQNNLYYIQSTGYTEYSLYKLDITTNNTILLYESQKMNGLTITDNNAYFIGKDDNIIQLNLITNDMQEFPIKNPFCFDVQKNKIYYEEIIILEDNLDLSKQGLPNDISFQSKCVIISYDLDSGEKKILLDLGEGNRADNLIVTNHGIVYILNRSSINLLTYDGKQKRLVEDILAGTILIKDTLNNVYYIDMGSGLYQYNLNTNKNLFICKTNGDFYGIINNQIYWGNGKWTTYSLS